MNRARTDGGPPVSRGLLDELSETQYAQISKLLDESIEMAPAQRAKWFAELEDSDRESAAILLDLFALQTAGRGFLESRNVLAGHVASLLEVNRTLVGKPFGPYRVLSHLGQGGMGSVWLAERVDGLFSRVVALKLMHTSLMGRVTMERLAREREILATLDHPNIARLFDAGFAGDGQPYLALEYVAGTPFTAYCDDRRLSIRARLELFRQVLSAVQYAHAHLVIHRDLKPSNILVTENGQVYLLDFGIAKLLTDGEAKETELTQLGGRALTPEYAAPEQISGAPITTAADVYALGVMLYEVLTGEGPYRPKRESRGALEEAILQAEPVLPSRIAFCETAAGVRAATARKLARTLKGDLDTITLKALKKSPLDRYATAAAFGEDIARYLRGDVVLAQPDSVVYRALKFTTNHRVAIAAAGVVILILAGGLAATTYEAEVASVQRDAALQAQLRSLTQTAAARLGNADIPGALAIVLEVLPHRGVKRSYTAEALSVFQQARAADARVMAITGHTDRVRSAAFSPDGRRIVTASWDRTARIWDVDAGRELMRLSGHTDRVWSAAFSPDGRRIVTASHDGTARIWDCATGRQILLLSGHQDRVTSAVFSPDGRRVVTASYDKTARVWDATTGQQIQSMTGHADLVMYAMFSPDGRRVVTASHDKTARIWDAGTGRQLVTLRGHTDWIITAAFSPDGLQIVTASHDKTAALWDALSGRQIRLLSGHTDRLWFAAFSPDGRRIATASFDKTARIWEAATGRETMRLSGHSSEVVGAAISPDGRRLVTASYDKTAFIWNMATGPETMLLSGHTEPVASASFSADGRRVVTGSYDRTARIWDAATGRELMRLNGHTDQVLSAAFSPDGRRVVTASPDKTARIWDAATGRELLQLTGHTDQVVSAAFSPDGRRVATASLDKTARVWDAAAGREVVRLSGHADMVETADFSPDGRRIVTASHDKTARIWDASGGRELAVLSGHTERVESAAFSHDGRRVVTASADKTARIWDATSGRQLMMLSGHADLVEIAAFSHDGRHVVTASDDKTARIWDSDTGRAILLLGGHTDRLWFAAFSPDGQRVVTASDDGTARIWDVRVSALDAQIGWSEAAQFDPLPSAERFQLGLPGEPDVRQWPADASTCDHYAAAPYDPDRLAPGVTLAHVVADVAAAACAGEKRGSHAAARAAYQHGRALMAGGNFPAARAKFEEALAHGYRAASVDLGMAFSRASSGAQSSGAVPDVPRAISLYERGWKDGVAVAGFELGNLYEHGVRRPGAETGYSLSPDQDRAWFWYRKAAEAGDPNALARFAERDDDAAFFGEDPANRNAHRLEAFKQYAAAAERARIEDWPGDSWRNWRYHRASLARLLAREGMMQEVSDEFSNVRARYAP